MTSVHRLLGRRHVRSIRHLRARLIVDACCHAGRGDLLSEPWRTAAPLGPYLRRARDAGIDRTVVLPASHTDYGVANRELARLVAAHRPRLIGYAGLHAVRDAGRIQAMVAPARRDGASARHQGSMRRRKRRRKGNRRLIPCS
jgi:hypothetical protein